METQQVEMKKVSHHPGYGTHDRLCNAWMDGWM
eukprot:COSAG05_NODE_448_length_9744_cov_49.554277_9_plen_33_part_00